MFSAGGFNQQQSQKPQYPATLANQQGPATPSKPGPGRPSVPMMQGQAQPLQDAYAASTPYGQASVPLAQYMQPGSPMPGPSRPAPAAAPTPSTPAGVATPPPFFTGRAQSNPMSERAPGESIESSFVRYQSDLRRRGASAWDERPGAAESRQRLAEMQEERDREWRARFAAAQNLGRTPAQLEAIRSQRESWGRRGQERPVRSDIADRLAAMTPQERQAHQERSRAQLERLYGGAGPTPSPQRSYHVGRDGILGQYGQTR